MKIALVPNLTRKEAFDVTAGICKSLSGLGAEIFFSPEYKAEFELQAPIFIPNYWFTNTPQYGQSSANISTGTAAWFLKIYHDFYGW